LNSINSRENPEFLNDYLVHIRVVRMLSERTISEYYFDTRIFLKYIHRNFTESELSVDDISIADMQENELKQITSSDIYNFLFYASDERKNAEVARYRKVSSLRSFFRYLTKVRHTVEHDPSKELDISSPRRKIQPKFLSLDESRRLLQTTAQSDSVSAKRDYCIITVFLNCGVRLSELVSIDVKDIDFTENRLKVLGKGNKERTVYLNQACIDAVNDYLTVRNENKEAESEPALFISSRNKRISKRRVQQIVESKIKSACLDGKGISTHKLRHTAATLMYQYGNADVLTLKELLGHESTATTEIYTHLSNEAVRNAVESNPLADFKNPKDKK